MCLRWKSTLELREKVISEEALLAPRLDVLPTLALREREHHGSQWGGIQIL